MRNASARGSAESGRARVMILSAGVGSGHNSAAAALRQACLDRDDVDEVLVIDVLQQSSALYRDLLGKGYFALVESVPWLVDWGYDISDSGLSSAGRRSRVPIAME
jgi:processive 1,2-diacylglycerol beta-glucosyltransferase